MGGALRVDHAAGEAGGEDGVFGGHAVLEGEEDDLISLFGKWRARAGAVKRDERAVPKCGREHGAGVKQKPHRGPVRGERDERLDETVAAVGALFVAAVLGSEAAFLL